MKPKILVAGNSVVDLIFKGEVFEERKKNNRLSLAFGGKYVPDYFFQFYGGGGTNAAISLARQGFDTMLWTHLGHDVFGKHVMANLKKEGIKTKLVKFKAEKTPISSILLTPSGERTIINFRSNADLLVLTNSVVREMKRHNWFALFSLAKCPKKDKISFLHQAKTIGLKVFLSLNSIEYYQGFEYLKDYFRYTDILHLNAHELADIFGGNAPDFDFKKTNFAQKLNLPLLVVTHDVNGSSAYTPDKIYHQPIIKVKNIVDTTGAGDAFASGFLGQYIKTDSIEAGLHFGAKNAASVIQQLGAQNGLLSIR